MQTATYSRKAFDVEAVRVTEENMEEVAKWCRGHIREDDKGEKFIKVRVHRPSDEEQTKARIGKWLLGTPQGYKVYSHKAFTNSFKLMTVITEAESLAALNDAVDKDVVAKLGGKKVKITTDIGEPVDPDNRNVFTTGVDNESIFVETEKPKYVQVGGNPGGTHALSDGE